MDDLIKPSDLKNQAEQLIQDKEMPSLDEVLTALSGTRKKWAPKIAQARKMDLSRFGLGSS